MNLETPSPQHGAAFRILFEEIQPMNQAPTRDWLFKVEARMRDVRNWALRQNPSIAGAYMWAADEMSRRVRQLVEAQELSQNVVKVYETLPRPPAPGAS